MISSGINVLLIDQERIFAATFRVALEAAGFVTQEVRSERAALEAVRMSPPNVIIKPSMTMTLRQTALMEQLSGLCPDIQFLIVSPHKDVRMAMAAIRRGAFDCLPLPCEGEQLVESVRRAVEHQRLVAEHPDILARLRAGWRLDFLVGDSLAMRRVKDIVERVAGTDVTVLIQGESGTGKELVARLIHEKSRVSQGPFVAVNCAALSDSIIESELFGHVKGAFTGAVADKPGRFALASGGTLFLDEIGDLSPKGQADLLRVLEDGVYRPVGSPRTATASARIVAASNRILEHLCQDGRFREDLLYRLNVIVLHLAPLRERTSDIPSLAEMFLRHFCARHRRPAKTLSPGLIEMLQGFEWPGNVRQLRNVIERMTLLVSARTLLPEHLQEHLQDVAVPVVAAMARENRSLAEVEVAHISEAIARAGGNKTKAARALGISRRSLHYRLKSIATRGDR